MCQSNCFVLLFFFKYKNGVLFLFLINAIVESTSAPVVSLHLEGANFVDLEIKKKKILCFLFPICFVSIENSVGSGYCWSCPRQRKKVANSVGVDVRSLPRSVVMIRALTPLVPILPLLSHLLQCSDAGGGGARKKREMLQIIFLHVSLSEVCAFNSKREYFLHPTNSRFL